MQATLALSHTTMCARPFEKELSILSPPGDLWIRVTLGKAPQGDIRADVQCYIGWFPGERGRGCRVQG